MNPHSIVDSRTYFILWTWTRKYLSGCMLAEMTTEDLPWSSILKSRPKWGNEMVAVATEVVTSTSPGQGALHMKPIPSGKARATARGRSGVQEPQVPQYEYVFSLCT